MDSRVKIAFGGPKKQVPVVGLGSALNRSSDKSASAAARPIVAKAGVFDDDDDNDNTSEQNASASTSSTKANAKTAAAPPSRWPGMTGVAGAAPMSRAARERQEAALALDATVNDYDGVYDAMKSGERSMQRRRDEEKRLRDPKYMAASLAASEQRKLDRQRAEAKKIQRERDEEGDAYEATEAFVTDAYKQQMDAMREAEAQDKAKEEHDRAKSRGVAGFYKDMLAEQERSHRAAVDAAAFSGDAITAGQTSTSDQTDSEEQRRRVRVDEARQKGLDVRLNDDNEVVDERSLLSAGLNTLSKRKRVDGEATVHTDGSHGINESQSAIAPQARHNAGQEHDGARAARQERDAQRQRQSRQMEEQMLAAQRQREETHRAQEHSRKQILIGKRRNDDSRIAEARQRALERRQKQHQHAAG